MKTAPIIAAIGLAFASLAAHAVGQRADLTIFDRATHRELPVYWHEGRAYVVGRPGSEYQVVVRNRVGEDLLAVVSVDGLNVMNGEAANARQAGYIMAPWTRLDVRGWRKSMEEVAAFYFTQLSDSYAGRTGRPANVGVIGVALFQRKRHAPPPAAAAAAPEPAPYREKVEAKRDSANESSSSPKLAQAMPAPSAPLGTGHGRREESRVQWQHFERASDSPVETIAIYYDSYRNLVAQGVLQAPAARRDPNPFPTAFTPDP